MTKHSTTTYKANLKILTRNHSELVLVTSGKVIKIIALHHMGKVKNVNAEQWIVSTVNALSKFDYQYSAITYLQQNNALPES